MSLLDFFFGPKCADCFVRIMGVRVPIGNGSLLCEPCDAKRAAEREAEAGRRKSREIDRPYVPPNWARAFPCPKCTRIMVLTIEEYWKSLYACPYCGSSGAIGRRPFTAEQIAEEAQQRAEEERAAQQRDEEEATAHRRAAERSAQLEAQRQAQRKAERLEQIRKDRQKGGPRKRLFAAVETESELRRQAMRRAKELDDARGD